MDQDYIVKAKFDELYNLTGEVKKLVGGLV